MNKLIKPLFVIIALSVCSQKIYSQYSVQQDEPFWKKIFWGGSIGFSIGTITQIDFSPLVGVNITERWKAGIGGTYQYYKDNRPLYNFETDIYGGRVFSSFVVIDDLKKVFPVNSNGCSIFLHGEVELLSLESRVFDPLHKYPGTDRFYIDSYLLGAGIRQKIGARAFINLTVLWNLNDLTYSPYSNPVIRLGFNF
ncbi:MAG: hypothetical protein HY958_05505 [Bacteroidia bacterium]|nr:hypothetical protein [Bacteroidia bacterium]